MMSMLEALRDRKTRDSIILFIISLGCFFINTTNIVLGLVIHSIAMIPLAFMLGEFTSSISEYIGEKKGGLLTATLGNLPEIIMGIWSLRLGLISMVQAAMIGCIVNNMLLVLGVSILLGGLKYKQQTFNKNNAKTNFSMLLLAMSSMVVMACINNYSSIPSETVIKISAAVSIILICVYLLGLIYSLYTHSNLILGDDKTEKIEEKKSDKRELVILLIKIFVISLAIYFLSEKVINDANIIIENFNISEGFMGIILIPVLGNIGENISAIMCAVRNKVNLSLEIAIGSGIQIALFATPILVLTAFLLGIQMALVFSVLNIIIAGLAIFMSYIVFVDGSTNWFEGIVLIAVYVIITICYFFV